MGIRVESEKIILDPVLPFSMDGFSSSLHFLGHLVTFSYTVKKSSFSPKRIHINGKKIDFIHEENKYRLGGAVIGKKKFLAGLNKDENVVEIFL